MSQQYNRSLLAPVVILPTGQRQPYGQILDYDYNVTTGSKITINRVAGAAIAFTPNNPDTVLAQLDRIPSQTASIIEIEDDTLAWTSITPSTGTAPFNSPYAIVGTGFASVPFTNFKLDDGGGDIISFGSDGFQVNSGTSITFNQFNIDPVGAYTVYYSMDNGSTWITTALTVTIS